jgi:hypothetical protein
MANNFYNHGSFPTTGSAATSASMRAELDSIAAGFDKMPTLTGNANEIVVVNPSATGLDSIATLPATSGGTGFASYAVGDLLFASTTTALSKLADVATGNALISGGVGVAPSYGKIGLTTHVSGTLPVANGGTGITSFGTGVATALGINVGTAGAFVVNGGALGTPSSGTLTNATGLPVGTGISGLGTNVATALAVNVGTAGAFVVYDGALGTPSSGTLTNATGLPVGTGISGLGTNVATALAVNVGTAGAFVVNGGALGTPSSGTLTNATGLPLTTGVTGTLPVANGGTGLTAGTSGGVLYYSATGTLASSAALAANALVVGGGAGIAPSTITTGTGVVTALGVNTGTAGAFVVYDGALGTPSSGTVTNLTGTASININGTVGATTPASGSFSSLTDSGNLTFTGTGNRITGDFSNATVANRVMFQTSTVNGTTSIATLPNGTNATSSVLAFGGSDPANAPFTGFNNTATESQILASKIGTGTYLPMTFYTGGSERMRIDTSGNVGIGTSSPGAKLEVKGASATAGQLSIHDGTGDTTVSGVTAASLLFQARDSSVRTIAEIDAVNTTVNGTGGAMVFQTRISDTLAERMRIDSSGYVGIGTASPFFGGLTIDSAGVAGGSANLYFKSQGADADEGVWRQRVFNSVGSCYFEVSGLNDAVSAGAIAWRAIKSSGNVIDRHEWYTNGSERARIDSSGNLLVGTTSSSGKLTVLQSAAAAAADFYTSGGAVGTPCLVLKKQPNDGSTSQVYIQFLFNNAGSGNGQINGNGSGAAAFGSYSDERLKENIV